MRETILLSLTLMLFAISCGKLSEKKRNQNIKTEYNENISNEEVEETILNLVEIEDLHESLKSFCYPIIMFETSKSLIRIDCIEEPTDTTGWGIYRYASWKKGSSIGDKPVLLLTNGRFGINGPCNENQCYFFENGNYTYEYHIIQNSDCDEYHYPIIPPFESFRIYKSNDVIFEEKQDELRKINWIEEREFFKKQGAN
ncbi:hypothetical protein LJC52_03545 [Bacteroidales bacterium OttesenSCG-928-A17]|nr:hypothetical protein [Bacteroidales bacterium OttesenSCG-928-A17]